MKPVEEIAPPTPADFEREIRPLYRPLVIRGVARDWPLVAAGRSGADAALGQIAQFDSGAQTDIMAAPPEARGRFFYGDEMRGFNFERRKGTLSQLAAALVAARDEDAPPALYASAAATAEHLPGFDSAHPLPLATGAPDSMSRLWLGNATQVATHFDLSDNFAVVVLGRRRFTLFPPEAVGDLYVGPLDMTLAGQPVSMVDPLAPDHAAYPRYARAEALAQVAELEPGDAIYIPTLWWHHVAAQDPVNIMVNYWHNHAAHGGGFLALLHALMAMRDLPPAQKSAWRAWFDHFVLGEDAADAAAHLPDHAQGVAGPASPERDARMRRYIAAVLSQ